jgi:hypothetical protein
MFGFLQTLRSAPRRNRSSPRGRSFKPAVEGLEDRQLMSLTAGTIVSGANLGNLIKPSPQLTSFKAGAVVSGISANLGNLAPMQTIPQQQFSHLTSVSDVYYGTVDFEITADYSVWFFCATGDYAGQARGQWHNTGGYALSVSAGMSAVKTLETAAVYVIGGDNMVWRFDSQGVWTQLGAPKGLYALSISGEDIIPYGNQVYAIFSDSNLWVYSLTPAGSVGNPGPGWQCLGSPGYSLATISVAAGQGVVFATDIYGEVWENNVPANGSWTFTGGVNTVQIAASYDGTFTPMVYALTTDHKVRAYEQGRWWDLNMYALEISAYRTGDGSALNTVYAIGRDHAVYIAHPNWTGSTTTWQDLYNYVTAISAEAGVVQSGSSLTGYQVFATLQNNGPIEWASYNGPWGWAGLDGPDMMAQPTPLS